MIQRHTATRYSEFVRLRDSIKSAFSNIHLPKLPPKVLFNNLAPDVVEQRKVGLEYFINVCISAGLVTQFPKFKQFLTSVKQPVRSVVSPVPHALAAFKPFQVEKAGFLTKQGKRSMIFVPRYFVIIKTGSIMPYYRRLTDIVPAGIIELANSTVELTEDAIHTRHKYAFSLTEAVNGKVHILCAGSHTERLEWIEAINKKRVVTPWPVPARKASTFEEGMLKKSSNGSRSSKRQDPEFAFADDKITPDGMPTIFSDGGDDSSTSTDEDAAIRREADRVRDRGGRNQLKSLNSSTSEDNVIDLHPLDSKSSDDVSDILANARVDSACPQRTGIDVSGLEVNMTVNPESYAYPHDDDNMLDDDSGDDGDVEYVEQHVTVTRGRMTHNYFIGSEEKGIDLDMHIDLDNVDGLTLDDSGSSGYGSKGYHTPSSHYPLAKQLSIPVITRDIERDRRRMVIDTDADSFLGVLRINSDQLIGDLRRLIAEELVDTEMFQLCDDDGDVLDHRSDMIKISDLCGDVAGLSVNQNDDGQYVITIIHK